MLLPNNAISQLDARAAERVPRWRYWLGFAIRYLLLGLSLFYFGGLLIASITQRDPFPLVRQSPLVTNLFIMIIVGWHFGLMLHTLILGAVSIAGERESGRWDLLLLTGISARQLVRGKWAALVRRQLPAYLWLAAFRVGAIAAWTLYFTETGTLRIAIRAYPSDPQFVLPSSFLIILSGLIISAMTLANLVFTAGCAVLASAISPGRIRAILSAIAARLAMTLGIAISIFLIGVITGIWSTNSLTTWIGKAHPWNTLVSVLVSLVDNGLISITAFIFPTIHYGPVDISPAPSAGAVLATLLGSLGTLVLYGLLTRFSLRRAERRLIASGVSPSPAQP